ncbi:MAG: zinc-binding dehydrogenase [Leptolyngbyaceae cyanobacterium]
MYETDDRISQHKLLSQVSELVEKGALRFVTEHLGSLGEVNLAKAHDRLEAHAMIGKLV